VSPLPNARAIPTGWSAHHAPVAVGGMNGRCRIYDPATTTIGWDEVNEVPTVVAGDPAHDGPCRIEPRLSARDIIQADDEQTTREYLVQVEMDAPAIHEGWELVPYQCINDARLNGITLRVDDEELGTERFTRDLFVTRVQG
jgi:hypothetical protein